MPRPKKGSQSPAGAQNATADAEAARAAKLARKQLTLEEATEGLKKSLTTKFADPSERAHAISFYAVKLAKLSHRPYSAIASDYQIHAGDPQ